MGKPGEGYPWKWSVYRWLEGESASSGRIDNLGEFAAILAQFLIAFESIDSTGGPAPGLHSFYRGGSLANYDAEVKQALHTLRNKIDTTSATAIWDNALKSHWQGKPVWVHGDISAGNLLVRNGKLVAVIDFGQLTIGDPACDLAIAWTLFQGESRAMFQTFLNLDTDTWARARGWTLWKALVVAAGFTNPGNTESKRCWQIIDEVIKERL